ncbi:MAG: hypothetical protein AAFQ94_30950 [Bacteroidota bacterium]
MIDNKFTYRNNRTATYTILLCISINCVLYAGLLRLAYAPFFGIILFCFGLSLVVMLITVAVASYRILFKSPYTRLSTDGSLLLVHYLPYFLIGNVLSELITLLIYEILGIQYFYLLPYQAIAGMVILPCLRYLKLVIYHERTVYISNFWDEQNILMKQIISIDRISGLLYRIRFSHQGNISACYFIPHFIKTNDPTSQKLPIDEFTARCYRSHLNNPVRE